MKNVNTTCDRCDCDMFVSQQSVDMHWGNVLCMNCNSHVETQLHIQKRLLREAYNILIEILERNICEALPEERESLCRHIRAYNRLQYIGGYEGV